MWITPKTDWDITTYINTDDYNRIKGNISYLYELSVKLSSSFSIENMGSDRVYSQFPYASDWNTLEANIKTISKMFSNIINEELLVDYGYQYVDNGRYVTYTQLNAIETYCLELYEILENSYKNLRRLPVVLGRRRF